MREAVLSEGESKRRKLAEIDNSLAALDRMKEFAKQFATALPQQAPLLAVPEKRGY